MAPQIDVMREQLRINRFRMGNKIELWDRMYCGFTAGLGGINTVCRQCSAPALELPASGAGLDRIVMCSNRIPRRRLL